MRPPVSFNRTLNSDQACAKEDDNEIKISQDSLNWDPDEDDCIENDVDYTPTTHTFKASQKGSVTDIIQSLPWYCQEIPIDIPSHQILQEIETLTRGALSALTDPDKRAIMLENHALIKKNRYLFEERTNINMSGCLSDTKSDDRMIEAEFEFQETILSVILGLVTHFNQKNINLHLSCSLLALYIDIMINLKVLQYEDINFASQHGIVFDFSMFNGLDKLLKKISTLIRANVFDNYKMAPLFTRVRLHQSNLAELKFNTQQFADNVYSITNYIDIMMTYRNDIPHLQKPYTQNDWKFVDSYWQAEIEPKLNLLCSTNLPEYIKNFPCSHVVGNYDYLSTPLQKLYIPLIDHTFKSYFIFIALLEAPFKKWTTIINLFEKLKEFRNINKQLIPLRLEFNTLVTTQTELTKKIDAAYKMFSTLSTLSLQNYFFLLDKNRITLSMLNNNIEMAKTFAIDLASYIQQIKNTNAEAQFSSPVLSTSNAIVDTYVNADADDDTDTSATKLVELKEDKTPPVAAAVTNSALKKDNGLTFFSAAPNASVKTKKLLYKLLKENKISFHELEILVRNLNGNMSSPGSSHFTIRFDNVLGVHFMPVTVVRPHKNGTGINVRDNLHPKVIKQIIDLFEQVFTKEKLQEILDITKPNDPDLVYRFC